MNILQKHQMYSLRRRLNQPIWQSFKMEFLQFRLRESEKMGIVVLIAAITLFIAVKVIQHIDYARYVQFKRATVAENALDSRELMIVTMLNRQYIRIDGVKRKVKLCDAANECE